MHAPRYSVQDLLNFPSRRRFLAAIDSDGCVFDTMEVKQKDCFHPEIIRHWGLEPLEGPLRDCAEFINLYSRTRGQNRFVSLLQTFELFQARPEVAQSGFPPPPTEALRDYIAAGRPLSNEGLAKALRESPDPDLRRVLDWSLRVNEVVAEKTRDIPPFAGVIEALEAMGREADLIVCSQTPEEALVREWEQHGIAEKVAVIAGQELGSKADHLRLASTGRYPPARVLMIGDALGDQFAAASVGAHFFPILPGEEPASWQRLRQEAFPRLLHGAFTKAYQASLTTEFEARLPAQPPWADDKAE